MPSSDSTEPITFVNIKIGEPISWHSFKDAGTLAKVGGLYKKFAGRLPDIGHEWQAVTLKGVQSSGLGHVRLLVHIHWNPIGPFLFGGMRMIYKGKRGTA